MEDNTEHQFHQTAVSPVAISAADAEMLTILKQTKTWVRFLAVIALMMTGLVILASIAAMIFSVAASEWMEMSPVEGLIIGVIYLLLSVFYAIPAILLWNFGSRIGQYLIQKSNTALRDVLESQRVFWKAVGIITLIWLVLTFLFFLLFIVLAVLSAMTVL